MESKNLEGMRVAILATDDFEESELIEPRKALDNAGAKTTVLAPKAGKIQAMKHDEKTIKIGVDRTLDKADANDFDRHATHLVPFTIKYRIRRMLFQFLAGSGDAQWTS